MQREVRRSVANGLGADRTPDAALQPISRNLRSASGQPVSVSASARRAREFIAARTKTPGKTLQLQLQQQTPTSAFATTRRLRATPGRGWVRPTTPHGAKALQSRNAITPGRTRRQSGRVKKETPRDLLRALSRVLPRPEPDDVKEKENLEPTMEVPEEDEDSPDEQAPELSFGVDGEDSGFEVEKGRRFSNRGRLSLADDSMLRLGLGPIDESSDIEDKPVTRLLDESLDSDDLEPPNDLTVGYDEQPGDTVALRQLMALTRSPETPHVDVDPLTPTANISFELDIPDLPPPEPHTPMEDEYSEDDEDGYEEGGFEIRLDGELENDLEDLDRGDTDLQMNGDMTTELIVGGSGAQTGVPELGIDFPKSADFRLAQKQVERKAKATRVQKTPRRNGLSKTVIKRIASSFLPKRGMKQARLKRGVVDALVQATDWFVEQASGDLAAYAQHAGRRRIDESDFLLLAQRQRLTTPSSTLFSLANKYLPRELLREVQGVQNQSKKGGKQKAPEAAPSSSEQSPDSFGAGEMKRRSRKSDSSVSGTNKMFKKRGGRTRLSDISATTTPVESLLGKRKRGRPGKSAKAE